MNQTARPDPRIAKRVSIDPEPIAKELLAIAADDLVATTEAEATAEPKGDVQDGPDALAVVDKAAGQVISSHNIDRWKWFEVMYLVEWLTAEHNLHTAALTAHVVEDASVTAFEPVSRRLVRTALRHTVREEVLGDDLSRGFDPTHRGIATPPGVVRIDTEWFPTAPACETYGRLLQNEDSDLRAAAQTTIKAHFSTFLALSLTEQVALIEHLVKSGHADGSIEFGRAQEGAREGLSQLVATFLWFTLEDAIVSTVREQFD
jgi:hypothetical protein